MLRRVAVITSLLLACCWYVRAQEQKGGDKDDTLAPLVQILAVNHVFDDPARPIIEQGITAEGIVIENDAWIGAGAIILDGVRVGQGAVVGAGAVVTRDVPPHTVVAGNPASVVKTITGESRTNKAIY